MEVCSTVTKTRSDGILWAQLGCALVITAHAEYTLAVATSVNEYVALALPGALDLYVIRALQKHRDVFPAVLVMVGAVISSHLVAAGMLQVSWVLVSAVGALAPLLVWRGHKLRVQASAAPGAVSAPEVRVPDPVPAWVPGYHLDGCDGVHALEGPLNCTHRAWELSSAAPDHVPAWVSDEYPVPHLAPVPALPDEYVPGPPSTPVLEAGDLGYVDLAREYAAGTDAPSVRGLKEYAGIGQARASRLLKYVKHAEEVQS